MSRSLEVFMRLFRTLALAALAALLALLPAPSRADPACRPGEDLAACATRQWRAASAAYRDLFLAPARGMEPYSLRLLTASPWELVLAREVEAVAECEAGLAAACADGAVLVSTAAGLRLAQLPDNARPASLAWAGGRHLAVLDAGLRRVFVLNLDTGRFAAGAHDTGEAVSALSLSREGLLSLADAAGRVWTGPVLGPLATVGRIARPAVALGLSRDLGVLAAADGSGEARLIALRPVRELGRVQVAGGPFVSGRVQDNILVLARADGASAGLDLAARQHVAAPPAVRPASRGLAVGNRTLVYRPGPDSPLARVWKLTTVVERRFPTVWRSALGRVVRLEDFDGQTRYYRLGSGRRVDPAPAGDWERLSVDQAGRFTAEGESYALADVLFQDRGRALLVRYAPDVGWYAWWQAGDGGAAPALRPGWLPVRSSLRADAALDWVRMAP